MDRVKHLWLALLLVVMASGACGGEKPPLPKKPILDVVNHSEHVLLQLMLHSRIDDYRDTPNRLAAPLPVGGQVRFAEPIVGAGTWFVTVIRETVKHGDLVAVTTGNGLVLDDDGIYVLWVYDENFYLWPPKKLIPDGPLKDGGRETRPPDGPTRDGPPSDRGVDRLSPPDSPRDGKTMFRDG